MKMVVSITVNDKALDRLEFSGNSVLDFCDFRQEVRDFLGSSIAHWEAQALHAPMERKEGLDVTAQLEARITELEKQVIAVSYVDEVPMFRQGQPTHEVEELLTAEDVKQWVLTIVEQRKRIKELEQARSELAHKNAEYITRIDARIAELAAQNQQLRKHVEMAAAHVKPTCFDLYDKLQAVLALPDLATKHLNRVKAEALRLAFDCKDFDDSTYDWSLKISALADAIEKGEGDASTD